MQCIPVFPGHIIDCSKFLCGMYTDTVVSCAYEVIAICGTYVAFGGIFVIGT